MKGFLSSWGLAVALLVPTVSVLVAVEILNVAPEVPSRATVRLRRSLLVVGGLLLLLVAVAIAARFVYLST